MGAMQRRKGSTEERSVVNFWRSCGVDPKECLRVPLSGATEFAKADVRLKGLCGEVKVRASGYKTIYDQLGDNDFLAIRENGRKRLYVVPEHIMRKLLLP